MKVALHSGTGLEYSSPKKTTLKWDTIFSSTKLQWQHFQLFQSSINTNGSWYFDNKIFQYLWGGKKEWIKYFQADLDKSHLSYSSDNGQECIYEQMSQITLSFKKRYWILGHPCMAWLFTQYIINLSAFPHYLQSLYHSSFRPAWAVSECSSLGLQKKYFKKCICRVGQGI